eukprot:4051637-Pleurochrysis_carterae.AAC.1
MRRRHLPQFVNVAQPRLDHGALEDHQHQQREERVVPVVVKRPQDHAQDLKHEKRRECMLLEQRTKGRPRDAKVVQTKRQACLGHRRFRTKAAAVQVEGDRLGGRQSQLAAEETVRRGLTVGA